MLNENTVSSQSKSREIDAGLKKYLSDIYAKMAGGVLLTAITAMVVGSSPFLLNLFLGGPQSIIVMLAPLAIVMFGFRPDRMEAKKLMMVFMALAVVYGISFASIAVMAGNDPAYGVIVAKAFFIATGMFAGVSILGYTTKIDLTPIRTFASMAIWGVIIAGLLNMFVFKSSGLDIALSMISIPLFAGITAWQTQNMKEMYSPSAPAELVQRYSWSAALTLYISFIAMFMNILNLMSQR
ncbi:MAG: Bax inhibitor-1 family protein [Bdellovibrionales bacterium]